MSVSRNRASRIFRIVVWLLSILAVWVATAWIGHRLELWAIELTNAAFAAAIVWTYVAAWGVVVTSSHKRRLMMLRCGAVTLSVLLSLIILEAPAVIGLVDYGRLRGTITGEWSGPAAGFIVDHEFSFRRPPNTHWSGNPRSDMAQYFNLPLRASYQLMFS